MVSLTFANQKLPNHSELRSFFNEISAIIESKSAAPLPNRNCESISQIDLEKYFTDVHNRMTLSETQQSRIDKRLATAFNIFNLIEPDENKLSDILADLLDPDGPHGQGDLFLRLLFKKLDLNPDPLLVKNAKVQREAPTYGIQKYRRRMDILVEAGVLLAIENKVDSIEQQDQIKDYLDHLRRIARDRGINSALIYLTPYGRKPESLAPSLTKDILRSGSLYCWSYQVDLRTWLESCRRKCKAIRMQDFLSDFIGYIESNIKQENEFVDGEDYDYE
jgi:hypothetical protein